MKSESPKDRTQEGVESFDGNGQSPVSVSPQITRTEESADPGTVEASRPHPPFLRPRQWLLIVGAIAVLIGAGFAWRWRQSSSEGQAEGGPPVARVRIAEVSSGRLKDSSEYVANLRSPESVTLRPQIEGRVSQIFAKEGDRVRAGTPILQVDPEEQAAAVSSASAAAEAARAEVENARATLASLEAERQANLSEVRFNQKEYARYASLAAEGAVARQVRDQYTNNLQTARARLAAINQRIQAQQAAVARAQKAVAQAQASTQEQKAQLQYFKLTAPFEGIVGDIPVQVGDLVDTSTQLATVTQNQSLEVNISIPTERAADLRLGLPVELVNAQGQILGTSRVSFISPDVNEQTQSILVRAIFNNASGRLRTDQFTRARVIWSQQPGVSIPTTAVSRLAGKAFVFVAEAGQSPEGEPQMIARQKPVELGSIQGNNYQVLKGLQPGDRIITSGLLGLQDGAPVVPES